MERIKNIDSKIFSGKDLYGNSEELFGQFEEVMKSGNRYIMNCGDNFEADGFHINKLLVLDVDKRTLLFSSFGSFGGKKWTSLNDFSVNPKDEMAAESEEWIYARVTDFMLRMVTEIAEMEGEEAEKVAVALKEGVVPLSYHYYEAKMNADQRLRAMRELEAEVLRSSLR